MTPEVKFDPSLYPRTYSLSRQSQSFLIIAGFAAIAFPMVLWVSHSLNPQLTMFVALLFVPMGGYSIVQALTLKLVLDAEAVIVRNAFSSHKLLRCEIAGWRAESQGMGTGATGRTLLPRENDEKVIALPDVKPDTAFFAWFVGIPEIKPTNIMDTPPRVSFSKGIREFIGIMIVLFATFTLIIFLPAIPFGTQIVSLVMDTEFVFFLVFCDSHAWHGYRLHNKRVRQEIPHLLRIHVFFLAIIFGLLTFALSIEPRLPSSWIERGPRHESFFAAGLIGIGAVTAMTQAWILRKILRRAVFESSRRLVPSSNIV